MTENGSRPIRRACGVVQIFILSPIILKRRGNRNDVRWFSLARSKRHQGTRYRL